MVENTPPHDPGDADDDLAALDYGPSAGEEAGSDLDTLDDCGADELPDEDGGPPVPVFTVTNPPGTVAVTTFLDGRVQHIDLTPKATDMTEADLAEEIVVIAGLATDDARSAQYLAMLEGMRRRGHDDGLTRDFLTRDLDLPTPEESDARRAEVFATRYASDDE